MKISCFHTLLFVPSILSTMDAVAQGEIQGSGLRGHRDEQENIIGGTGAPFGKYPGFAIPDLQAVHLCGATLIWGDILLTTASCLKAFGNTTKEVFLGGTKRDGSDALEHISIRSHYVHPSFKYPHNDVMLVALSKPSNAVATKWNSNPNGPVDNEAVTAIGFGETSDFGSDSQILQEVNLNIVNLDTCNATFEGEIMKSEYLCAGNFVKNTCGEDGGGPLLRTNGEVVGLTSAGAFFCDTAPTVFTRVSTYDKFIQDGICSFSAKPPSSCFPTPPNPTPPKHARKKCSSRSGVSRSGIHKTKGGKCV